MSFRIINFLKYPDPNNAIVLNFDSRLINAINFLPNWCVLQIFFHKYISFKFKALFLHINWQCSSLACVTNSTSSGSSDTVSLSWIQCKCNRANMCLSTFQKTATNQNSQFGNNWGRKTWGFLEKSCFTFCDFHWVLFLTVQWHLWFWKERKIGRWCKPKMRDWLYCSLGYGHGSAPYHCIRDIQLLPIRIRISVFFLPPNYNCDASFSRGLSPPA